MKKWYVVFEILSNGVREASRRSIICQSNGDLPTEQEITQWSQSTFVVSASRFNAPQIESGVIVWFHPLGLSHDEQIASSIK